MIDRDVLAVQAAYPKIYLACHRKHIRASSTRWKLSSHDSAILAHLDEREPTAMSDLQEHLGVAASTLSASVKRLVRLGYVDNRPSGGDMRRRELTLTGVGVDAMRATSVLDEERVRELLSSMPESERRSAVDGLLALARAADRQGRRTER